MAYQEERLPIAEWTLRTSCASGDLIAQAVLSGTGGAEAGLTEETMQLGRTIQKIPEQFGALVILVDHDMSLVSACCQVTAVLDFGKLIAVGPTAEVLRNDHVMRAYLGTEDSG